MVSTKTVCTDRALDESIDTASVSILLGTARDTADDRVDGFEHGTDDYLVKPFARPELVARVRAPDFDPHCDGLEQVRASQRRSTGCSSQSEAQSGAHTAR